MNASSRYMAFVGYLLSLPGAIIVLLSGRRDPFVTMHARQSLAIAMAMLLTPLLWAVIAWLFTWVPLIGSVLGLVLFALVIAAEIAFVYGWISGMVYALQGRAKLVPLVGRWVIQRTAPPPPSPALAIEPTMVDAG